MKQNQDGERKQEPARRFVIDYSNLWQLEQICCSGWDEAAQGTAGCVAPDERVGQLQLSRTTRLDGDGNCGEPH